MPFFLLPNFLGVDPILGPEMRSTGEVMGIGNSFGQAFAKGQLSSGQRLPTRVEHLSAFVMQIKRGSAKVAKLLG